MDLGTYKGRPVFEMRGKLTNTGDGLSESLAIEPQELGQGQRVFILCEATVEDHNYKRLPNSSGDVLVVTFKAATMTLVDADFAEKRVDEQKERNLLAQEAKAGINRLWETADKAKPSKKDKVDLVERHNAGVHAGRLVKGCPECEAEIAATTLEETPPKPKRGRPRKLVAVPEQS